MLTIPRRARAVTLALLFWGCSEVTAPTVSRVVFDRHTATLWAGDVLVTSVSVVKTDGEVVANPSVTYTSSNPRVASVDGTGKVYTHMAGQAMISAAVGSITDTLEVTVLWPPVTHVVFAHDSLVMSVGDTVTTGVFVFNSRGNHAINATPTYASSAPSIATVGEVPALASWTLGARIAAVGEGRATITVTAERLSDSLPVTVTRR